LVFIGGAVLAEIYKDRPEFWITKQEIDENGIEKALEMHGIKI